MPVRTLLVGLIADCASSRCRHGRACPACPGHPRRAAAKTGLTTARPVAKAHSREAFCFCCLLTGAPCAQSRHGRDKPGHDASGRDRSSVVSPPSVRALPGDKLLSPAKRSREPFIVRQIVDDRKNSVRTLNMELRFEGFLGKK